MDKLDLYFIYKVFFVKDCVDNVFRLNDKIILYFFKC